MSDYDLEPARIDPRRMVQRPSDMRAIEKITGRTFGEVIAGGDADTFQALALIELRRRDRLAGRETDPSTLWEMAGDLDVIMSDDAPVVTRPDPLGETSY